MNDYPRPFKPGPIEPVAQVGQNLLVIQTTKYRLYQVAYTEQVYLSHPLVVNLGAPAAGVVLADFNTNTVLDMQDGELIQLRAFVLDDIHVVMLQPLAVTRGITQNVQARLNAFLAQKDPCHHTTEIFIFGDQRIFLRGQNPTLYALAQARVAFYGIRYVLAGSSGPATKGGRLPAIKTFPDIQAAIEWSRAPEGEKFTIVPIGGWGR